MTTQLAERPTDDRLSTQLASDWGQQNITCHLAGWQEPKTFLGLALSVFAHKDYGRFPMGEKLRAVQQFALLGLMPGPENHAYVIPRGSQLDVMPGYKGFLYLAQQQPGVRQISVHLVHAGDTFEVENIGPDKFAVSEHRYDVFGDRPFVHPSKAGNSRDPAKTGLRGGYCRKEMDDGRVLYHFVPAHRIHSNLDAAQTKNVATRWPDRMYRKTVVRACEADDFFGGDPDVVRALKRLNEADNDAMGNDPNRGGDDEKPVPQDAKGRVLQALAPPVTTTPARPALEPVGFDAAPFWEGVQMVAEAESKPLDEVASAALAIAGLGDPADLNDDNYKVISDAIAKHLAKVEPIIT